MTDTDVTLLIYVFLVALLVPGAIIILDTIRAGWKNLKTWVQVTLALSYVVLIVTLFAALFLRIP